jgi:hypothetical protein
MNMALQRTAREVPGGSVFAIGALVSDIPTDVPVTA